MRFYTALLILLLVGLVGTACDDPVDGAIGGVVFLVRGVPTEPGSRFAEVSSVTLAYDRVEGIVEGGAPVLLDSQQRSIKVSNAASDTFVAQFQVPVGSLEQIRFFPTAVTLQLSTGDAVELDPETSDLPSWRNSGWKVVPVEDEPFEVREDQLTGVAALLEFDDRFVARGRSDGWLMKPTVPAVKFDPNPGATGGGPFMDRVTLVLRADADPAEVQALHDAIGATVVEKAPNTTWIRVKLPVTTTVEAARDHYRSRPDLVQHVVGSINFANYELDTNDDDDNVDPLDLARVREAWEEAVSRTGQVGSMDVTVAIIEPQGFDLTHPDLYRNIYLNQGEIPQCLRAVLTDCDPAGGDGLITIRDLECEENAPFRPADVNANSLIDAEDLIQPFASPGCEVGDNGGVTGWTGGGWADGIDDDPVAGDENAVFVDDIAGWDFGLGSNDAGSITPVGNRLPHATTVAGIIGAEGDNGIGTAGSLWRVSIVPLLANASNIDLATISDVNLSAAIDYVEARGFDIVNISAGWQFFLSNYGSRVTVFAAGGPWQGVAPASSVALVPASTSFAAPQVAGAAALLLSVEPAFKHDGAALKAALVSSAGKLLDATCSKGDAPIPLPVQPVLDARALLEETP